MKTAARKALHWAAERADWLDVPRADRLEHSTVGPKENQTAERKDCQKAVE